MAGDSIRGAGAPQPRNIYENPLEGQSTDSTQGAGASQRRSFGARLKKICNENKVPLTVGGIGLGLTAIGAGLTASGVGAAAGIGLMAVGGTMVLGSALYKAVSQYRGKTVTNPPPETPQGNWKEKKPQQKGAFNTISSLFNKTFGRKTPKSDKDPTVSNRNARETVKNRTKKEKKAPVDTTKERKYARKQDGATANKSDKSAQTDSASSSSQSGSVRSESDIDNHNLDVPQSEKSGIENKAFELDEAEDEPEKSEGPSKRKRLTKITFEDPNKGRGQSTTSADVQPSSSGSSTSELVFPESSSSSSKGKTQKQ